MFLVRARAPCIFCKEKDDDEGIWCAVYILFLHNLLFILKHTRRDADERIFANMFIVQKYIVEV